ncbi:MAG: hypothetical protein DCC75_05465, partial [Proteobacteria bacterium]
MDPLSTWLASLLVVLLFSAFIKIYTTLSILRFGLSLQGAGFGLIFLLLSIALTGLVAGPELDKVGGIGGLLKPNSVNSQALMEEYKPVLRKQANPELSAKLEDLLSKRNQSANDPQQKQPKDDTALLLVSFLLTELKEALELGLIIIIPFLIVDLLIANLLMVLGITQMPVLIIALPL